MANGHNHEDIQKKIKEELKQLSFSHDDLFKEYKKRISKEYPNLDWVKFIEQNGLNKSFREMFSELGNDQDLENLNTLNNIIMKLIENKTVDVSENFRKELFEEWNKIVNK